MTEVEFQEKAQNANLTPVEEAILRKGYGLSYDASLMPTGNDARSRRIKFVAARKLHALEDSKLPPLEG